MKRQSSDDVGGELLRLFGLPVDTCRKAVITLEAQEPVKIEAEFIGDLDPETQKLKTILKKYEVVEAEDWIWNPQQ